MNDPNVHLARSTFDRILKESYQNGFADAAEKLKAEHEEEIQRTIADIFERAQERCDEEFVHAFELGRTSGIDDERGYQNSLRHHQIDVGVQVDAPPDDDTFFTPAVFDIPLPVSTSEAASQTSPSASSAPLPVLTPSLLLAPILPTSTLIFPSPSVPSSIPPPSPSKLSWADDLNSLPIIPLIKPPRDLSSLRSETKPFSTIRHRNRRRYQTARRLPIPHVYFPVPCSTYPIPRRYPHLHPCTPAHQPKVAPFLPPALDWDRDPRLFELSRVLRGLGWSHS